jgi:pyridoxamine 5'-phosphate oxidase
MRKNSNVELCFYRPGEAAGTMMRVSGKVEFLTDHSLEARLFSDRPWVKDLMKTAPAGSDMVIFRVAHGEAYFWTMAVNMKEEDVPRVRF